MATVVRIPKTGGPEVLALDEVTVPPPGPGEVLLRQTAIGVNYIDIYHRSGVYPLPSFPHGLGMEAAAVVEATGPGVDDFQPGDRVTYAAPPPGAYATSRTLAARHLVPLPDDISDRTAASMMLQGMTVEYLIRRTFTVEPGMTVLFHAAAGGVGLIACQWLAHLGVTVIGTVSSEEKGEVAREHGCAHPIVTSRDDFVQRVRELTDGKGVPVVYDSIGRDTFLRSLDCLSRRGTLVSFGNASGVPEPFDPMILSARGSLYLTRPVLFDYTADPTELRAASQALFDVVRSGAVKVNARHEWPLREVAAAHRELEARRTTGSIVLTP